MNKMKIYRVTLIVFLSISGIILTLILKHPIAKILSKINNFDTLAITTATFSFTILGFLATVVMFIFTQKDSPFIKQYLTNQKKNFIAIYFTALFSLLLTFCLSMSLILYNDPHIAFFVIANTVSNIMQLAIILIIFINLILKDKKEVMV